MAPSADELRRKRTAEKNKKLEANAEAIAECKRRGYFKSSIEEIGENGETPLLTCVKSGNTEGMELLYKAGANPEARDKRSFTAFLIACDKGLVGSMTKIMQILGVGVTQDKDSKGGSPLWVAAASNSLEAVRFLFEKEGAWTLTETNNAGESPLFAAARNGHHKMVEYLANKGGQAMLTMANSDGLSPLQVAASGGHMNAIKTMMTLSDGKVLDDDAVREKFAIDYANKGKHKEVAEYLKNEGGLTKGSSTCTLL